MQPELMAVVLFGALLHASWNALVRSAPDKLLDAALVVVGAGVLAGNGLVFLPLPAVASWPYLAASVLIHVAVNDVVPALTTDTSLNRCWPRRVMVVSFDPIGAAFGQIEEMTAAPGLTVRVAAISSFLFTREVFILSTKRVL